MLAWHVDYWDRLGWKDPFGSKYATERQTRYRAARNQRHLVTPQLYADNEPTPGNRIRGVVEEASARAPELDATIEPRLAAGKVAVRVAITARTEGAEPGDGTEVRVVLYATKASTEVPRGENAGKTLTDAYPVCDVSDAVKAARALGRSFEVKLKAPPGVEPADLGVAVLVEDPDAMRTVACWQVGLPRQDPRPSR